MAAKKELVVEKNTRGELTIHYEGGGQLPDKLQGMWTSEKIAKEAIRDYQREVQARIKESSKAAPKQKAPVDAPVQEAS